MGNFNSYVTNYQRVSHVKTIIGCIPSNLKKFQTVSPLHPINWDPQMEYPS